LKLDDVGVICRVKDTGKQNASDKRSLCAVFGRQQKGSHRFRWVWRVARNYEQVQLGGGGRLLLYDLNRNGPAIDDRPWMTKEKHCVPPKYLNMRSYCPAVQSPLWPPCFSSARTLGAGQPSKNLGCRQRRYEGFRSSNPV
jgi:hypothetical protein